MVNFIASIDWPTLAGHASHYGFMLIAAFLLLLLCFDFRRTAKLTAKKTSSMQFLSRYRDENGMPIFFEEGEDPSARSAHRVLTRTRRASAKGIGQRLGQ
jgi:hypothetical protein